MRRTAFFLAAIVALTPLAAGNAKPVLAAEPSGAPADLPDGAWWDPETGQLRYDAAEHDAGIAAARTGIPVARIDAQFQLLDRIEDLQAAWHATFGAPFVGVYWDDDATLVAQFQGEVPAAAIGLLSDLAVPVRTEIVRYSEADLDEAFDELQTELGAMGLSDVSIGLDPARQVLAVSIGSGAMDQGRPVTPADVLQRLPTRVAAMTSIDILGSPTIRTRAVAGGARLLKDGALECTTGFSVVKGGTTGVATAGHCAASSMDFYNDPWVGEWFGVTYKGGHIGVWGDVEWFTTAGPELDDFYHTPAGAKRDVTSVKNTFSVGDPVFWFGQRTLTEFFSTIRYTRVAADGRDHLACTVVDAGDFGDSGGPVYNGNVAAGLHMGGVFMGGAWRFCFSQARYIDDAIGVSIKTS